MHTTSTKSEQLFAQARQVLVGGVNSPVRAFRGVEGTPCFIERAQDAYLWDADGNKYIDYVGSWGPMILGHAHPAVVAAIKAAAEHGTSFGAPCRAETTLAQLVCDYMPAIEMVRFVNSGTEATMSALRLARGATKRDAIVKFAGCYHGHADSLLVKAGSGVLTLGQPDSAGVPADFAKHTLVVEYNDLAAVQALFAQRGSEIAAIIVEPVAGNMGCIPPLPGFLTGLRQLCDQHKSILIFDEVMTGFRVARGGAQELYGVRPDLTCLGKIIGGGLPVGAYGGRRELMELVAPLGPVYQAGTLSGNPLAMAAGIATLKELARTGIYERLTTVTEQLVHGLTTACQTEGTPGVAVHVGAMWGLAFAAAPVHNLSDMQRSDVAFFCRFFHAMLQRGIHLAPSAFEAGFVSAAHSEAEIVATIQSAQEALAQAALS